MTEVPAQYESRTFQRKVADATTEVVTIPAEYATKTVRQLISEPVVEEVPCGKTMTLDNINFESGSAVLTASSYSEINVLRDMLNKNTEITAKLVGHTDSQGGEAAGYD